jgi:EAL domain-containing protein (putative c-di-GMP-specific phosphodiesterase class I)
MNRQFNMIKLVGWEKLVSKFNPTVSNGLWNDFVSQLRQSEMLDDHNAELVRVCDAKRFLLVKSKQSKADFADEEINAIVTAVHELLGLSVRQAISIELYSAVVHESENRLQTVLNQMLPKEYTLLSSFSASNIDQILKEESIQSFLQPIFNLHSNEVAGYELLTRGPEQSPLFGADKLFSAAQNNDLSFELEYLCIKKGLSLLGEIKSSQFLTANINPNFLSDKALFDLVASAGSNPQLKLELTEHLPVEDWAKLRTEMEKYNQLNLDFWLDDAGCGYFGLETIEEVRPVVVKLCLNLIRHIETDESLLPQLRQVVKKVHDMGSLILAEGVETEQQDVVLRALDVDLVQGYYYAKPQRSDILLSNPVFNSNKHDVIQAA